LLKDVEADDMFPLVTCTVTLPHKTRDFNNVPMGPKRTRWPDHLVITGHGGRYHVYFDGNLVA
jgi:hypothetical protein